MRIEFSLINFRHKFNTIVPSKINSREVILKSSFVLSGFRASQKEIVKRNIDDDEIR